MEPVAAMAERELLAAPGESDRQLAWARCFAKRGVRRQDHEYLNGLLDGTVTLDGLTVDADLRWEILLGLAAAGVADQERIDAEPARDQTASGRRERARCLAARPLPQAKAEVWDAVAVPGDHPKELLRALRGRTRQRRERGLGGRPTPRPRTQVGQARHKLRRHIASTMTVMHHLCN